MNEITTRELTRRDFLALSAAASGGVLLAACGVSQSVTPAASATLGPMETALSIYNWDGYLSPDTLTQFKAKYPNLQVSTATYASNEDMLAKIEAGAKGYDIVVPTGYMIQIMIEKKLLRPIDKSALPNFSHIDARFSNPGYDPGAKYSVPKDWGTTGFTYRTDLVKVMSDFPYPKPTGKWYELKVNPNPFPDQIRALELIRNGLQGNAYMIETVFNPWNVAQKLSSKEDVLRLKQEKPEA